MRTIATLAVTVLLAGPLLSACGDDTQALSKPDFIEQANAICQTASDAVEPIFDAVFEGLDDVDFDDPANQNLIFVRFAEVATEIRPIWVQMSSDLRDLHEPDEDHEQIEALLDDFDAAMQSFVDTTAAAAAGDEAAMQLLDEESEDPFTDVDRRARDYGLSVCGEDG